ncbi:MAG TPA: HAMP domain-containing methyl-accepting chemotaxis protein [Paenibacillus sp.]
MKKRIRITLLISMIIVAAVPSVLNMILNHDGIGSNLVILGISLVVALVAAWFTIHFIASPLSRLVEMTHTVSLGDLTKRLANTQRKDEIGELSNHFQRMVDNLSGTITSVRDTTGSVAGSAEQLASGAEQTTKAIEDVTVAIQEMAIASEQQKDSVAIGIHEMGNMSSQIMSITEHIREVTETMDKTNVTAEEGNASVISVVEKIEHIQHTVDELGNVIQTLGALSENIGGIVGAITGIAKQTSLLALNASIEAARAGEEGRGFAVVASEVRKLAEESEQSAHQIEDLIGNIQSEVHLAQQTMENAKLGVSEGIVAVDTSGRSFSRIRKAVRVAASKMEEVSDAAQELQNGARKVTESINGISSISEGNLDNVRTISAAAEEQLASIQEVAASSNDLSRMALHLDELVKRFKVKKL